MKINSYTKTGTKTATTAPKMFTEKVNEKLLLQAIRVYRDRGHQGTSKVQSRGEVSLVKQKWYKQKGTGNARHGAKSAPIFVGGGKAHGPKGFKRVLLLPKKMRQKALASALAAKANKQNVVLADLSSFKKTKDTADIAKAIRKGEEALKAKLTFIFSEKNNKNKNAFTNLDRAKTVEFRNINAYSVYFGGILVFDKDIFTEKKGASS